jgi:type II secretion system protein H
MRAAPSHKHEGNAFTLIELMVVCVLIGILTAVILPEMTGSYQDALLRSTSRKLINAFDLAYSQAVSRNQTQRVRLDIGARRYLVERCIRGGGREQFVPAREVTGSEGELDSRISIKIQNLALDDTPSAGQRLSANSPMNDSGGLESAAAIAFYPDGTADGREVILRDRQGFGLALKINPITARVRITEAERQ